MPESSVRSANWAPGCGDERLAAAVAAAAAGIPSKDLFWVGCSAGLGPLRAYGYHAPHGRGLPLAVGAILANPALTVLLTAETGLMHTQGLAHLYHAAHRNIDMACLVDEAGPAEYGPAKLALEAGAGFVARVPAGDAATLAELLGQALAYHGFALIERVGQTTLPTGILRNEAFAPRRPYTRPPAAGIDLTPPQREELLASLL